MYIIKGYSTYNSITIKLVKEQVHFLSHQLHINNYTLSLKRKEIKKLKKRSSVFEGHEEEKRLHNAGEYFNKRILLSLNDIKKAGRELQNYDNTALIKNILDREFDDNKHMGEYCFISYDLY